MNMKNVLELDELELCNWIYIISIDIDRNYGEHLMYLPYHLIQDGVRQTVSNTKHLLKN